MKRLVMTSFRRDSGCTIKEGTAVLQDASSYFGKDRSGDKEKIVEIKISLRFFILLEKTIHSEGLKLKKSRQEQCALSMRYR